MRFWLPIETTRGILEAFEDRLQRASLPLQVSLLAKPGEEAFIATMKRGRTSVLSFAVVAESGVSTVSLIDSSVSASHRHLIHEIEEWFYHHASSLGGGRK